MKIVCLTSNAYSHVIPGFVYCWTKYWGEEVEIVGYDVYPNRPLPGNFSFTSLGHQSAFSWSSGLSMYLWGLRDDHLLLVLEDYWLDTPVDLRLIEHAIQLMVTHPDIGKIDLTDDRLKVPHSDMPSLPMIISDPDSLFQTSLQAAIWQRHFLLSYLSPDETPWEFEKRGTRRLIEARQQGRETRRILGYTTPPLHYINAVGGEGSHPQQFAKKRFSGSFWAELLGQGVVYDG